MFRTPPVVHIYNVVEYGRRFYRSLAFTSDTGWCLHDVQPAITTPNPYLLHQHNVQVQHLIAGDPLTPTPSQSSIIIRRLLSDRLGVQTLIPPRLLGGLLPSALLNHYEFWQVLPWGCAPALGRVLALIGVARSDGIGLFRGTSTLRLGVG